MMRVLNHGLFVTPACYALVGAMLVVAGCGKDKKDDGDNALQEKLGPAFATASDARVKDFIAGLPVVKLSAADAAKLDCLAFGSLDDFWEDCPVVVPFKGLKVLDKDNKEVESVSVTTEGQERTLTVTKEGQEPKTVVQEFDAEGRITKQTPSFVGGSTSVTREFGSAANPFKPTLVGDTRYTYGGNGVPADMVSLEEELEDGKVRRRTRTSCEGLICTEVTEERPNGFGFSAPKKDFVETAKTVTTYLGAIGGIPARVETSEDGLTRIDEATFKDNKYAGNTYSGKERGENEEELTVSGGCTVELPNTFNCTETLTNAAGTMVQEVTYSSKLVVAIRGDSFDFDISEFSYSGTDGSGKIVRDTSGRLKSFSNENEEKTSTVEQTLEYSGDGLLPTKVNSKVKGEDDAEVTAVNYVYTY
jgi:hypothetical protein